MEFLNRRISRRTGGCVALSAALLVASPMVGQFSGDAGCVAVRIEAGNTLYSIASANGKTVKELAKRNDIENPNEIQVGDIVCVDDSPGDSTSSQDETSKSKCGVQQQTEADFDFRRTRYVVCSPDWPLNIFAQLDPAMEQAAFVAQFKNRQIHPGDVLYMSSDGSIGFNGDDENPDESHPMEWEFDKMSLWELDNTDRTNPLIQMAQAMELNPGVTGMEAELAAMDVIHVTAQQMYADLQAIGFTMTSDIPDSVLSKVTELAQEGSDLYGILRQLEAWLEAVTEHDELMTLYEEVPTEVWNHALTLRRDTNNEGAALPFDAIAYHWQILQEYYSDTPGMAKIVMGLWLEAIFQDGYYDISRGDTVIYGNPPEETDGGDPDQPTPMQEVFDLTPDSCGMDPEIAATCEGESITGSGTNPCGNYAKCEGESMPVDPCMPSRIPRTAASCAPPMPRTSECGPAVPGRMEICAQPIRPASGPCVLPDGTTAICVLPDSPSGGTKNPISRGAS